MVIEDLNEFLRTVGTARTLREVQPYLPVEEFDFDLRRLADAEITTPQRTNAVAPLKRSADLLVEADLVRIIGTQFDIVHVQAAAAHLEAHPHSAAHQCIFLGDSLETVLDDPDMVALFRRIQALTSTDYYRHPGDRSATFSIFDETVVIELSDGSGFVPAILVTDDEAVLAWAEEVFERCRREAEPIVPGAFTAGR